MAARLWSSILSVQCGLALLLGAGGAHLGMWPWRMLLVAAAVAALGLGTLALGACFLVAQFATRRATRREPLEVPPAPGRAFLTEWLWSALAAGWMMANRTARRIEGPASHPGTRCSSVRPVLLIHGFGCNAGVWHRVRARLQELGYRPIHALNLEPLCIGPEAHVPRVIEALRALEAAGDAQTLTLIAHSLGGLIARAALSRCTPRSIVHLLTIATPHHGSILARALSCPAAVQLRPDSPWLRDLNCSPMDRSRARVTCLYSIDDDIVAPAQSARLAGAELIELCGLGHFGLLGATRALDVLARALERPPLPAQAVEGAGAGPWNRRVPQRA